MGGVCYAFQPALNRGIRRVLKSTLKYARLNKDNQKRMAKDMKPRIIIPYNPKLKQKARYLRSHSPEAEVILWHYLKGKQMQGYDFQRQKPLLDYIVDFYCAELKLVIELDGYSHDNENAQNKDNVRDARLKGYDLHILRFSNQNIYKELESVLITIKEYIISFEKAERLK